MHVSRSSLWSRAARSLATALVLALAVGCGGKDDDDDDDDDIPDTPGGSGTVSGKVTYDFVPPTYNPSTRVGTLSFAQATPRPVRNGVVQVLQGTTVLATTNTDAQGNYRLSYTAPAGPGLVLVALAQTSTPAIQVEDNTDRDAIWSMGANIQVSTTSQDLHATHGWSEATTSYTASRRLAAPFAILDSMYTAAQGFLAVRQVNFPALKVNWSPDNVPESGSKASGNIGTSHFSFSENEIYILGKDRVDTDEFDAHVIVHEWGHYFEQNLSRSDSPGGQHSRGDVLDPRLSFGEGYGNALSGILLPTAVYIDTLWNNAGALSAFGFDLENEPASTDDPQPGVFSEASVMRLLYDLVDSSPGEAHDPVSIGLGTLYDVLVGPQRTTPALTTIGSFLHGLKGLTGVNDSAVDALAAHYNIGVITSPFGDGDSSLRSMYTQVSSYPYSTTVSLSGGALYNKSGQNRYYVFTGTGRNMSVNATSNQDVGILAYQQGQVAGESDRGTTGSESFSFASRADAPYVLVVTGFKQSAGSYSASLNISSQ
jgi:hypothetical protein